MTPDPAFAVWITGLPASGKSTLARALAEELAGRGTRVCILESDALRKILTPAPTYEEEERDTFYGAVAHFAGILAAHGVPVVIDATGNRRAYRDRARGRIPNFLEVYVECPLPVCLSRDPKGIYRRGIEGTASDVPGRVRCAGAYGGIRTAPPARSRGPGRPGGSRGRGAHHRGDPGRAGIPEGVTR